MFIHKLDEAALSAIYLHNKQVLCLCKKSMQTSGSSTYSPLILPAE